ncbi:MAG: 4-hydroxythreonine-4-phosphate dehydrogenase PdxA [Tannerella sp.]|jgi:4-hydroxythreonine-4-phosphate dehydrogenase|nr:4-hydroxythreonine-4-phosphate dehydrogenase PdxA [Tannerella sp.]
MEEKLIKVGITQGDSNGIGYEIILKAFSDPRMFELCTPIIYGSPKITAYYNKILESNDFTPAETHNITDAMKATPGKLNIFRCVDDSVYVEPGKESKAGGQAAFDSLEAATSDLRRGTIDALLTAPINKHAIQNKDFNFPGHTEYLERLFGDDTHHSLMILLNDFLRVALVTGHVPLGNVKQLITKEIIVEKLTIFDRSLREDFAVEKPRIAVLSLNPHAGDNGFIGDEEINIITPALEEVDKSGILAFGPYPADGFFGARMYRSFDGILAMYHDQGLAPFKALAMEDGVNFTAGLSVIRTSPAHGTAYDIAGKNVADESSFRHALYTLIDIHKNRKRHHTATANPLRKQYFDRSGDNEKLDLTKDE